MAAGYLWLFSPLRWADEELFDVITEIHAAEQGVFAGLVVGFLIAVGFYRLGLGLFSVLLLFSFGVIQVVCICPGPLEANHHLAILRKPWYFVSALMTTTVVTTFVFRTRLSWVFADERKPR